MRKHGWQLPYHPLQVVAVAVFLALGFAFYVFFAPFVGKKFEYIAIGLYTPLITCVFALYIWCAGEDPADPGVFKSRKYVKIPHPPSKEFKPGQHSNSLDASSSLIDAKKTVRQNLEQLSGTPGPDSTTKEKNGSFSSSNRYKKILPVFLSALSCNRRSSEQEHSEKQASEDGMFYCSLCEVEVLKYSKHCRVCDKCVDHFDHHCRWLNNCIGQKNYRKFFTLMVFTLLLLIVQWLTGVLVIISCFLDRKRYMVEISSKLGSSFSLVPFVIVVAVCTVLAMVATLPVTQLFCFHVLLLKKGISTYDYIMAMREQEQQAGGSQQSPQMSPVSSITRLSSTSSMNTLRRGAWCTPPRLLLEDQFDVVPPETASVSSEKKKKPVEVKISPWTLARLDAEEVSKAAAVARKKSRNRNNMRRARLPVEKDKFELMSAGESSSLAPLQLEARSAFRTSRAMSSSTLIAESSAESSLGSPDLLHPFRASSADREEVAGMTVHHLRLSGSSSDGYEASGGEDSDQVSIRMLGMGKGVAE